MIFSIVNDEIAYSGLNLDINLDLGIFLFSFLALFVLNCYILLEVYKIKRYIKKRGEK
jgi:hypothetical protein